MIDLGSGDSLIWPLAFGAVMLSYISHHLVVMKRRRSEMRALAMRIGFQPWPDDSTPRDLSLDGTAFECSSKIFNVYEGMLGNLQVAFFDFRKRAGKASWARTIIAIRTKNAILAGKVFALETKQVGEWELTYSPIGFLVKTRLMDVPMMEQLVDIIKRA